MVLLVLSHCENTEGNKGESKTAPESSDNGSLSIKCVCPIMGALAVSHSRIKTKAIGHFSPMKYKFCRPN